jgi:2-desacetyl-2-hydroxyethyl bacteriochlorophyllide A dehydrogenase
MELSDVSVDGTGSMRALVLTGPGLMELQQVEIPRPERDEVLIRVAASGVCGTDLHMLKGENLYGMRYPLILGHEFYGRIEALGEGVSRLEPGQWVVADPAWRCGTCPECQRGRPTVCDNKGGFGIGRNGGFAEFVKLPQDFCVPIPAGMPARWGVLAEPLACVLNGLDRLGPVFGDSVLVFGAGTVGLMLARVLQHAGASHVAIVDTSPGRLRVAENFLGQVATATSPDELTADRGWDVVADATGVPAAMEAGLEHLGTRGRFLLMGVASPQDLLRVRPMDMVRKEQSIISSVSVNHTVSRAVALLAENVLQGDLLLELPLDLDDFAQAFESLTAGRGLKVVLTPNTLDPALME